MFVWLYTHVYAYINTQLITSMTFIDYFGKGIEYAQRVNIDHMVTECLRRTHIQPNSFSDKFRFRSHKLSILTSRIRKLVGKSGVLVKVHK